MKTSKKEINARKELAKKRAIARLKQIKEQKVSIIADIYLKKLKENNQVYKTTDYLFCNSKHPRFEVVQELDEVEKQTIQSIEKEYKDLELFVYYCYVEEINNIKNIYAYFTTGINDEAIIFNKLNSKFRQYPCVLVNLVFNNKKKKTLDNLINMNSTICLSDKIK